MLSRFLHGVILCDACTFKIIISLGLGNSLEAVQFRRQLSTFPKFDGISLEVTARSDFDFGKVKSD